MKKLVVMIISFALITSISACGNENINQESVSVDRKEDDTDKEEKEDFEIVNIGTFKAENFNGETVTEEIFGEYDLTMVNLWTTTCTYCIQEMPHLEELRKEYQDAGTSFNIISVCMDLGKVDDKNQDNLATAKEIIEKTEVTYENLIPDDALLNGRLKDIQAFPESFFVDREGNIVSEPYIGANSKNHWRVVMNKELGKLED